MKTLSGLEIKLLVAGVALEEHKGDSEDVCTETASSLTRYVEVVLGSAFALHFAAPPALAPILRDTAMINVYLDGKLAIARLCDAQYFASAPYNLLIEGVDTETPRGRELQRFIFAQLETNDDPLTANLKAEDFKDLGIVTVKCIWARKSTAPCIGAPTSFMSAAGSSVPEKCLKGRAISNRASVSKAEAVLGSIKFIPMSYPYDLQIEGIIEKDPEPVALEDRDPASLTVDEVRQLQQQLQAKREAMANIKKEKRAWMDDDDGDDGDEAEVVFGGSQKKHKSTEVGPELIDLTDD